MNNVIYFTYYLLIQFSKRIKKNDLNPALTGYLWFCTGQLFNLFTVLMLLFGVFFSKSNATITGALVALIVLISYHFILYKKSNKIIEFYDNKYAGRQISNIKFFLAVFYIIISGIICYYCAYLVKNHKI